MDASPLLSGPWAFQGSQGDIWGTSFSGSHWWVWSPGVRPSPTWLSKPEVLLPLGEEPGLSCPHSSVRKLRLSARVGASCCGSQTSSLFPIFPSFSALCPKPLPQIKIMHGAEHLMLRMTFSGKPVCFHNSAFNCWELPVPQLRATVWTPDQQPEHHPGICQQCKFLGPIPENQILWGWVPQMCLKKHSRKL